MRRETIIIRCDGDGCGKLAEIEDKARMPEGWIQIRTPDPEGRVGVAGSGLFDLCSLRCTVAWALGRSRLKGEPISVTLDKEKKNPCPVCDKLVGLKGLASHVSAVHPEEDYSVVRDLWNGVPAGVTS